MQNINIKGINVLNPVDVEKDYLLYTVEYAKNNGFNHIQINGPIHNAIKGNIDGMTPYRKYEQFNNEKDMGYVKKSLDAINAACEKAKQSGIKVYAWHHELELPKGFKEVHPEILNSFGDIEITHPKVKDFLENKLSDFFYYYPEISGIILTLHETSIPILKLKDQKLGKTERVKYVTEILFNACKKAQKELIVRPFASIEEDYEMMAKAYEEISTDLIIMDKWTQFDWSLTMPSNRFFEKIRKNPLLVETDIYGEFFGRGYFPLMLKEHIKEKIAYCRKYNPKGYVSRIDRAGSHMFGDVNEVNIFIMKAYLNGMDVDGEINDFFKEKYPNAAEEMKSLMEQTEGVLKKIIYLNGYYFNDQSFIPRLNHSKNHYLFEMLRDVPEVDSNEWFIPKKYIRGSIESLICEKEKAKFEANKLFGDLEKLEGKIDATEYKKVWKKFANLKAAAELWYIFTRILRFYVSYFDTEEEKYITFFENEVKSFVECKNHYTAILKSDFFGLKHSFTEATTPDFDYIGLFADEIVKSFYQEKQTTEKFKKKTNVLDYVVCGGGTEGHKLQKEVNFSDTLITEHGLCRLAGSDRGEKWNGVNAHGWFSYLIKVKPNEKNIIKLTAGGMNGTLKTAVTIGEEKFNVNNDEKSVKEYVLEYNEKAGKNEVRIRFDKISESVPCIYSIEVI